MPCQKPPGARGLCANQFIALKIVGTPVSTVGQDSAMLLARLLAAAGHVSRELFHRVLDHGGVAKILLHLDDNSEASLNIDAAMTGDRRLQLDF